VIALQEFAPPIRVPTPVFAAAGLESVRRIFVDQPVETLEANQLVFFEGDPARHVYQLVEGVVRLCRLMPDGRRAVIGFVFPTQMLGIPSHKSYPHSAEAVTGIRLRRSRRTQLDQLIAEDLTLTQKLLAMVCEELSAAQEQLLLLGRKTAQERLATFLIWLTEKLDHNGHPNEVVLPLTRQDIADHLGVTVETVSRTIKKLKQFGAISLPEPNRLIIEDWALLGRLAGDTDAPPAWAS
jgi:CRP/FNR family transcriptional regulator